MDLQDATREEGASCSYGETLQLDSNCVLPSSCSTADPSTFLIRGQNYLRDNQKVYVFLSALLMLYIEEYRTQNRSNFLLNVLKHV